jgi:hypothetical protein
MLPHRRVPSRGARYSIAEFIARFGARRGLQSPQYLQLKGGEMLPVWWVLAAFVGGGSAAVLVTALMQATLRTRSHREHDFRLSQ